MAKHRSLSLLIRVFFLILLANQINAATVIKILGEVKAKDKLIKKGETLNLPITVSTGERSFVRIRLNDKDFITLGPNSKLLVNKEKEGGLSTLSLMKGLIRAKFEKEKQGDYKSVISTASSSLGVRGTDFLVTYNNDNHITSTLTFDGKVELYKKTDSEIRRHQRRQSQIQFYHHDDHQDTLRNLSINEHSEIEPEYFSGAFPGHELSTKPAKISKEQYKLLKKNEDLVFHPKIPSDIEVKEINNKNLAPNPDHFDDQFSEFDTKIHPGGFLDLKTGIYVLPEKKGVSQYEVPRHLGDIDPKSGDYRPPKNIELHPTKGFVLSKMIKDSVEELSQIQNQLNQKINSNIRKFKNYSHIDFSVDANFQYDSNVKELFYNETRNVSDNHSFKWMFDGYVSRPFYILPSLAVTPKFSMNFTHHLRRTVPSVKRNDELNTFYDLSIDKEYRLFSRRTHFIASYTYHYQQRDLNATNQLDFSANDHTIRLQNNVHLTDKHTTNLGYSYTYFVTHNDKDYGNLQSFDISHTITLGRNFIGNAKYEYAQRTDKLSTEKLIFITMSADITKKSLFHKFDVNLNGKVQRQDPKKDINFNKSIVYDLGTSLIRHKGDHFQFLLGYNFVRQKAEGSDNLRHIQQLYTMGLRFFF